jgi:acrylyl-CoA reductase (NADPH)
MDPTTSFQALRVVENPDGSFSRSIEQRSLADLPEGEVLVQVMYSGLNYKDALSATGHKGVTRKFPHTPGIDAAGKVAASSDERFPAGQEVIVTSYDLGMNTDGGFAGYIRVPADWVVPLPANLSLRQSMILGTGGFTAGLSLHKMEQGGQHPDMGPILVTGATGAVGSMAVAILAKAGYEVIASTGKASAHDYLKSLGATQIISREEVQDESKRPLLRPQWAGAIDTVGGNTLATVLKACGRNGNVACCGLVGSPKLPTTVYPFILNGINLLGAESAECPMPIRRAVWEKLAGDWCINEHLEQTVTEASLAALNETYIDKILAGANQGRVLVKM